MISSGGAVGSSNLVPWKPGQSGNPKGRPKGISLVDALQAVLKAKAEDSGRPVKTLVAEKLVELALAGNLEAIKLCFEYTDGKPAQPVDVGGPGGGPLQVVIRTVDDRPRIEVVDGRGTATG